MLALCRAVFSPDRHASSSSGTRGLGRMEYLPVKSVVVTHPVLKGAAKALWGDFRASGAGCGMLILSQPGFAGSNSS